MARASAPAWLASSSSLGSFARLPDCVSRVHSSVSSESPTFQNLSSPLPRTRVGESRDADEVMSGMAPREKLEWGGDGEAGDDARGAERKGTTARCPSPTRRATDEAQRLSPTNDFKKDEDFPAECEEQLTPYSRYLHAFSRKKTPDRSPTPPLLELTPYENDDIYLDVGFDVDMSSQKDQSDSVSCSTCSQRHRPHGKGSEVTASSTPRTPEAGDEYLHAPQQNRRLKGARSRKSKTLRKGDRENTGPPVRRSLRNYFREIQYHSQSPLEQIAGTAGSVLRDHTNLHFEQSTQKHKAGPSSRWRCYGGEGRGLSKYSSRPAPKQERQVDGSTSSSSSSNESRAVKSIAEIWRRPIAPSKAKTKLPTRRDSKGRWIMVPCPVCDEKTGNLGAHFYFSHPRIGSYKDFCASLTQGHARSRNASAQ